jgi:hypothetical protein
MSVIFQDKNGIWLKTVRGPNFLREINNLNIEDFISFIREKFEDFNYWYEGAENICVDWNYSSDPHEGAIELFIRGTIEASKEDIEEVLKAKNTKNEAERLERLEYERLKQKYG